MSYVVPSKAISDSILLTIEEGVTIYDQNFRLAAWNEKYVDMGITPPEHVKMGLHIEDTYRYAAELGVFGEGDPQEIATERIAQVYAGNAPAVEDLRGRDGRIIEVRRYFPPNIGVAAIFSDVTEARRLSVEVKRSQELELFARIAGGFCHDFNNVLQAVVANLQIADTTQELEFIRPALEAALSGAALSREMLQLARPSKLPEGRSKFDAIASIEATMRWSSRVLKDNVKIKLDTPLNSAIVNASEAKFTSVLANLIVNARDAMENGGLIQISVSNQERMLTIEVKDQGSGMPDEILDKADQPFFSTKGDRGNGLGVYEAKKFAEGAGGKFALSSVVGVGTTARMDLPAVFHPTTKKVQQEREILAARVLLIEDSLEVQASILHLLESLGCTALTTTTAEAAQQVLLSTNSGFYDVVISDVMLSGDMDGIELSYWISARFPDLNIVVCSGSPLAIRLPDGVKSFQKPINLEAMYDYLRTVSTRHGT